VNGPADEEFDKLTETERAKKMLNPSSSAAVIPLKRTNAELDAEVKRLDAKAEANSGTAPARPHILPSPSEPMAVAREFIESKCRHDGDLTLRYWRAGWRSWRTSHWIEVDDRTIRSELYQFTENAEYLSGKKLTPWAPTQSKISNLLDALAAICLLPADIDQPTWLDNRKDNRNCVIVATANGLLDVGRQELLNHSPRFFNQVAVPFDYDAEAPKPGRWLGFLDELFPDEPPAIDALGEWFGYVVSGRTDLHKIMLMVGPTRGGKGVIARVLEAMIGRKNVAAPTLNSLGGEFGLAPLIGKSLAIISDARFAGKDSSIVVERLLSISGEDSLTINRKHRDQWTGKLPTRLHVISNELPKLGDASTAIVGRMVLILLKHTWLGKEDLTLEPALQAELTGILNWALDGLQRLSATNKFTRLPSAEEAILAMRDLASPVGAFVRERCVTGANYEIRTDDLYAAFKLWADEAGHAKKSKQTFGRDLRAAIPAISVQRPRNTPDRHRVYIGIDIRWKLPLDDIVSKTSSRTLSENVNGAVGLRFRSNTGIRYSRPGERHRSYP
jgi:putative DNA primase/helicase